MQVQNFLIDQQKLTYYFDAKYTELKKIVGDRKAIIITDTNVYNAHLSKFKAWKCIVIEAGEANKTTTTVNNIVNQLIALEADRHTLLIGVGGGVVTDITGFVASIYMRGIDFGFVPSSLLNMVDASIGGKNGIDFGLYKNILGCIRQPSFILQDIKLLKTLPQEEWANGFAEIIKHACIKDAKHFETLSQHNIAFYQKNEALLSELIKNNILIKLKIVQKDVNEKGDRKLLNFGHTIGHAIENLYELSHGQAIAIGMHLAALISEKNTNNKCSQKIKNIFEQYQLPYAIPFDAQAVFDILKHDKKRKADNIQFILLDKIGKAKVQDIPLKELKKYLQDFQKNTSCV